MIRQFREQWRILPRCNLICAALLFLILPAFANAQARNVTDPLAADYDARVRPLMQRYCLGCHSTAKHKGGMDFEQFDSISQARKHVKPWQAVIEQLETEQMPPEEKPQPTPAERAKLVAWVHGFLNEEAKARAGDPGRVPMRRLSNAEYDYTIRDLTGVDLHPAKEFPADGAAGEGFTNAAEVLTDISPTLLDKYLAAAKEIAAHAVLLPGGFRFSEGKTRRDWTDQSLAKLRQFYGQFTGDGRLPLQAYLIATLRHREALLAGKETIEQAAAGERINAEYLKILWQTLNDQSLSYPLDLLRSRWKTATEKDAAALVSQIIAWQGQAWKVVPVGSYRDGNESRQAPINPPVGLTQTIRVAAKPSGRQKDVVLYLRASELFGDAQGRSVLWGKPRFEAKGKPPLMLRDYANFGPNYEADDSLLFAKTADYLAAVLECAHGSKLSADDIAGKYDLDVPLLKSWIALLALDSAPRASVEAPERPTPAVRLDLLDEKVQKADGRAAINGWRSRSADLPILITNSSNQVENVPGRMDAHCVAVHPTPKEFVAAAWTSPIDGAVRVNCSIIHAHPACGNGVAWWLEHRHADHAGVLVEGAVDVGGEAAVPPMTVRVARGDKLILTIDARDGNHSCDLTQINLTIASTDDAKQIWDLARDIAYDVLAGNPHVDHLGNRDTWSFVKGPTRPVVANASPGATIPQISVLGRWRKAVTDPAQRETLGQRAREVQTLLISPRPKDEKSADYVLYDRLTSVDGPLLRGLDLRKYRATQPRSTPPYGLDVAKFGVTVEGQPADPYGMQAAANSTIEIRLPAALLRDHEFVVDGAMNAPDPDRAVRFEVVGAQPSPDASSVGPIVAMPQGAAHQRLQRGFDEFRRCFPLFICYPAVIPTDEVVCLKMYHREDEPLIRLFLNEAQRRQIDRLWQEHEFISQQPIAENNYLPLFIGFVTQDQPKELVAYYEGQRENFAKRAQEFQHELDAAIPKQLAQLAEFTSRAYRRPLKEEEKQQLQSLYQALRDKGLSHEDAFRGVLARVFVSPSFLFRIEHAPAGDNPGPVNDWELATRLSYFLWSSPPDDELRRTAAVGKLHELPVLAEQTKRMLKDPRIRALAIEFGTQWIHVRGFDQLNEKSERLFPTFDQPLRSAMNEEAILFFQNLFQQDQPFDRIVDADYTYLNETLARHYGIPGVTGSQWRKVDGVQKFGRGGILALGAVQAKQAGAARTSPILRGNWVLETLLGEKLPRPPPNVPRLPEEEGAEGLTMRQIVQKHTSDPACATCHVRIDPIGFAFERYDAIGRRRDKESTGLSIDCRAKLKDGTEFEGIDGLRHYLLTRKRDVVVRLFCRRLLGYALGRSVALSDQPLLDEMTQALKSDNGRMSDAVLAIVRSPQFRMIRGSAYADEQ